MSDENKIQKKKICQMTSAHPLTDMRIFTKQCRWLADKGFTVYLVGQERDLPDSLCGVNIVTVPKSSSRWKRVFITTFQVLKKSIELDCDIYHFHDSEMIGAGIILKFFGKKVIYDVHEDVPEDIFTKTYLPKSSRYVLSFFVKCVQGLGALLFDGIVAATPSIASKFPSKKTVTVQNFPILGELLLEEAPDYADRPRRVLYVGLISRRRSACEIGKAMELVNQKVKVDLTLIGKFESGNLDKDLMKQPGWSSTQFLGWKDRSEVAKYLGSSRVGLVLFHPGPNHTNSQPNKLFEYMSAGIPVIASNFPLWREIVEGNDCGICVDPLDPAEIAKAIEYIVENPQRAEEMGKKGCAAVQSYYTWDKEFDKLLSLYNVLA